MARMGATAFESELSRELGSRTDTPTARLTRWRREGYWYIARIPDLQEFVGYYTRSVNPGTTSYTLPADLRAIYHIQETRPNRHDLDLVPRSWVDKRTFSRGDVFDAARQNRTLYLGNSLSAGTRITITYQQQPTLPTGTSTHRYDEEWERVHLIKCRHVAFLELFGSERAKAVEDELNVALLELGEDPKRLPTTTSVREIETRSIRVTLRPKIF